MNNTYPCIKVNDIETTIDWYVDFLGFQCIYKSTIKQPDYAVLEKGSLKIYIAKTEDREAYASNIIIIEVTDIKAEFKTLEGSGVIIVQNINKGAFSDKEFIIKDYEDNKIVYIQKI
jgi:uncharacterized glyoxalase superfamily protein PhnB